MYSIINKDIRFVHSESGRVGSVSAIKLYFTRMTIDSSLPIEVSFIKSGEHLIAVSPQGLGGRLEKSGGKYYYRNDIIFNENKIEEALSSIEETQEDEPVDTDAFMDVFGIDISGIVGISGMVLDRVISVDRMDVPGKSAYYDGYYFIFTDIPTKSAKIGFMVANVVPYSYRDYVDELNDYGKSRILSEVIVDRYENKNKIKNTSRFRVELSAKTYKYNRVAVGSRNERYVYEDAEEYVFTLEPGEEIELVLVNHQSESSYTLLDNPINPVAEELPIGSQELAQNRMYVDETPMKIELLNIMPMVSVFEPEKYIMISSPHDIINDRGSFSVGVFDKKSDFSREELHGTFGVITIQDSDKVVGISDTGSAANIVKKCNVVFKSKIRRIESSLGEKDFTFAIPYTISGSRLKLISVSSEPVFNDTISAPQDAIVARFAVYANANELIKNGVHLEYMDKDVTKVACKKDSQLLIKKLMGAELFSSDYMKFSINSVIDTPTKKLYSGPLYKTYDGEIDEAYSLYADRLKHELDGFYMINSEMSLSSTELATVMPSLNFDEDYKNECKEDLIYNPKEDIASLGLEYSVNEALKKLRKVAYAYRVDDEPVAILSVGMTVDGEWYFCGEDFFRAKDVEYDVTATYIDGEIKAIYEDPESNIRPVYDKKIFFDSIDFGASIYSKLQDMFMAVVTGYIPSQKINDNPGLRYIAEHLVDGSEKYTVGYDDIFKFIPSVLYSNEIKDVKNKLLMPNIFESMLSVGSYSEYIGDSDVHFAGKRRREFRVNYAIRNSDSKDLAYNIGHNVGMMIDTDAIKNMSKMLHGERRSIFGASFKKVGLVDSISVVKKYDTVIAGNRYGFSLVIKSRNTSSHLEIGFDYKTKRYVIDIVGNVKISNYALLLASFDIFLHDFYETLDGYKRVGLGVYELDGAHDSVDRKYLLSNAVSKAMSEHILLDLDVYVYDVHFELGDGSSEVEKSISDDGTQMTAKVKVDDANIIVDIDGSDEKEYSITSLENEPNGFIIDGAVRIECKKVKRFLPKTLSTKHVKRAIITSEDGSREYVHFGKGVEHDFGGGFSVVFALGGEGLVSWKKFNYGNRATEILVPIDNVVALIESSDSFELSKYGKTLSIAFE